MKTTMEVPFFRYPFVFYQYEDEVREALTDAAESGAYILQAELEEFEDRLAGYCGVDTAAGVGNATDGIELNLKAAGVEPGDEVILPAHTFVASAGAVVAVGAVPVFAEIRDDHLMDPADLEHRITRKTTAVMPTQLNGRTADMDAIGAVVEKHGLILLEDSAQGLGSRYKGKMAGTFGVAGVYSFYPAKTLGAFGDAGAVVTDDPQTGTLLRELRDHGRSPTTGEVVRWGRNSRLDNIHAAVLNIKLRHLEEDIARRRELASLYHERLKEVDEVVTPPPPQPEGADHYDVYQNYEIEADRRDALREHLKQSGIGTILQWGGKAVHEFEALGVNQELPRTEAIMRRALLLPMNTSLTNDEVDYICECVAEYYQG